MKTLKLAFCLLATLGATTCFADSWPWNCGFAVGGEFSNSVMATIETTANGDSLLRIYKGTTGPVAGPRMADFQWVGGETETSIPVLTDAPWDTIAPTIKHVVVEHGVTRIGAYAFYSMTALETLTLSNTVASIGGNFLSDNFHGDIYCSATNVPDASANVSDTGGPAYLSTARVFIPLGTTDAYILAAWWQDFGADRLIESPQAASVVIVPKDSITDSRAVIIVEMVPTAEKYRVLVESDDATDIRNFDTYYDSVEDKWVIDPIAVNGAGPGNIIRRMPAIRRDTVTRTTETLQIDITNLKPSSTYSYEVSALDASDRVVSQQSGSFKTPAKMPMGVDDFTKSEDKTQGTRSYNLLGQPVDESYRGIIITDTGQKLLRRQ